MTSWKRAADDDETLTTLGTVASSKNERMTRTVSVAIDELRLIGRRRDVRRAVDDARPTGATRNISGAGNVRVPRGSSAKTSSADAQAALLDGLEQRGVVDEVGAGRVDEHRAIGQDAR